MIVKMRIHLEKLSRLNVASIIVVSPDLPQQSFIQVFFVIVFIYLLVVLLRTVLGYHNAHWYIVYLVALWIIILIHNISKINILPTEKKYKSYKHDLLSLF